MTVVVNLDGIETGPVTTRVSKKYLRERLGFENRMTFTRAINRLEKEMKEAKIVYNDFHKKSPYFYPKVANFLIKTFE